MNRRVSLRNFMIPPAELTDFEIIKQRVRARGRMGRRKQIIAELNEDISALDDYINDLTRQEKFRKENNANRT